MRIEESELFLNADGSIYHLALHPEEIADIIIMVGDPDRVPLVSKYFDSIEIKKQKREFVTHTGYVGKQRVSAISSGISTDNIDIVLNELDTLINIDFNTRQIRPNPTSLTIIRVGTAGGLQADIPLNSTVASHYGIGMDGLGGFYQLNNTTEEHCLRTAFLQHFNDNPNLANTYIASGSSTILERLKTDCITGITVTCGGFYGPQGRALRAKPTFPNLIEKLQSFTYNGLNITNLEMETAGIYAMGSLLGHHCLSTSVIIANRITKQFSPNPTAAIENLIQLVLSKIE